MSVFDILLITFITIHWGYTVGGYIAITSNISVPRFLAILLTIKYATLIYGN